MLFIYLLSGKMDTPSSLALALAILDNVDGLLTGSVSILDLGFAEPVISYSLYHTLIDGFTKQGLNLQKTVPSILCQIDDRCVLPAKISNLTRKVNRYVEKNSSDPETLELPIQGLFSPTLSLCEGLIEQGITLEMLLSDNLKREKPVILDNAHIISLRRVVQQKHLSWKLAVSWITDLLCLDANQHPNEHSLRSQWHVIHSKYIKLITSGKDQAEFMAEEYNIPHPQTPKVDPGTTSDADSDKHDEPSVATLQKRLADLTRAYEELALHSQVMHEIALENTGLRQQVGEFEKTKRKFLKKEQEITELKQKIAAMDTRNVNRRLKRRDDQIVKLTEDQKTTLSTVTEAEGTAKLQAQLNNTNIMAELEILQVELDKIKKDKVKEQKSKHYWKKKCETTQQIHSAAATPVPSPTQQRLKQMSNTVHTLENKNLELRELIQGLITETDDEGKAKLRLFKDGKYLDSIRIVYMDLLEHCQNVVRTVLKNLLNVDVDRLPRKSLASILAVEAQIISQAQVAETMIKNKNNTMHFDGTKKHFKEYAGFQFFSMGHQLMATGDTESYLEATSATIKNLAQSLSEDQEEQNQIEAELFLSIKNIMTDRHVVNKCYAPRFEDLKRKYAGENLSEEQKESLCSINSLYCGLHILPNMATSAMAGMKSFEQKLDVHRLAGYNTANPVAYDLIFQVAKAFVMTSGCQKSGDALDFTDFLDELNVQKCHIITFLHNRFNVIFHDGGAVYHHHHHISDFLTSGRSSKNNRLLEAISKSIQDEHLLAECRAL